MLTAAVLAGAGFGQSPRLINLGGLFQRASIITGFARLTALSAQALQTNAHYRSITPVRLSVSPDHPKCGRIVRRR
jgi:hypothetical protein